MTDCNNITPCGGDCRGCKHFINEKCVGCRNNGGKCVSMWENGCAIYGCCEKHSVLFCGLCSKFPCEWLKNKIGEWDADGIERLALLADEYRKEHIHGQT